MGVDPFDAAVRALRTGGLVVYPTDTLFGLGARADDPLAVARLSEAKRRPADLPISVAVSSVEEIERLASLRPAARTFVRTHLPGPYTVIVRLRRDAPTVAPALKARNGTLGLRVPDHPVARELARRAGPITATSANRHGEPTPDRIAGIRRVFGSAVSVYLDVGPAPSGEPSRLVDLTGATPRRLARPTAGSSR